MQEPVCKIKKLQAGLFFKVVDSRRAVYYLIFMQEYWNPWHGCHKISDGCKNCYVYSSDCKYDKDSSVVTKNLAFNLPIKKDRKGNYKYPSGTMFGLCFTSDFLLQEADEWRDECWRIIKERSDCNFFFITKRIDRFAECIPSDWGEGYDNVAVGCTVENQKQADARLPVFQLVPIKHKMIVCAPLLEDIDLSNYLDGIEELSVGGESGINARVCDFDWVLSLRAQAVGRGVAFYFHQTGARLKKDGKIYRIPRKHQHSQAKKANINFNHKPIG